MIVLKYIFACCSCFSIVPVYVWVIMNKCFLQSLVLNSSSQRKSLKTLQKCRQPLKNVANSEKVSWLKLFFKKKKNSALGGKCFLSELGKFCIVMETSSSRMLSYFGFQKTSLGFSVWLLLPAAGVRPGAWGLCIFLLASPLLASPLLAPRLPSLSAGPRTLLCLLAPGLPGLLCAGPAAGWREGGCGVLSLILVHPPSSYLHDWILPNFLFMDQFLLVHFWKNLVVTLHPITHSNIPGMDQIH